MNENIEMLHELCHVLTKELTELTDKISHGGMSAGDLETIDKLTHALKSVKTTVAMMESEDEGYSGRMSGRSYGGMSYADYGRSYARGRRNAPRDSMGRFSGGDDTAEALRGVMDRISDPQARQELQYIIGRM